MAFAKLDVSKVLDVEYGRLYLFKMVLKDDEVVYKIGMCNSDRSTDRMMEVLLDFFKKYRYVPYCELKRDRKATNPFKVEKEFHSRYAEYAFRFDKKFSGSTEFFMGLDEEQLLKEYEDVC